MLLRARTILPITRPAIENGALRVKGGKVLEVGPWGELVPDGGEPTLDLGEVIVLPGLINAHCHLDYTGMAGQILPPKKFPDWIKALLALKGGWSYSEFARSWLDGANMLVRNGVTTVANIEAVPELVSEAWDTTPLRVFSFLEMTGVKSRRPPQNILQETTERMDSLPSGRNHVGLSPHAPYSTTPELIRLSARTARERGLRLETHVAESAEEFDMYAHRRGPLFDWLKGQRDMSDCGSGSPIRYLSSQGFLGPNLLAIHVNYLGEGDAELLGTAGTSVVHCPKSHQYFQHQEFPYNELKLHQVNVCLGTDSLASSMKTRGQAPELSMFGEMQTMARAFPSLSPRELVEMVTLNAARALGMQGQIGEIAPGACADLIVLPAGGSSAETYETVCWASGPVMASMVTGVWAIQPSAAVPTIRDGFDGVGR
jgi:cytosine/adenosine deaminase-related metal-dependent hydrolase